MKRGPRTFIAIATFLVTLPPVAAQDALTAVKDLYGSAKYDEALKVLESVDSSARKLQHSQYKVFCLLALDRTPEAVNVIERMLEEQPLFVPDSEEASPRVQELFNRVRTDTAPRIAKALYADAKASYDRKDRAAALAKFELLLRLIERSKPGENSLLGELQLLASGYADLAKAAATPAATPAPPPPPAENTAPAAPAAAFVTAVPIVEKFPPWSTQGWGARGLVFTGVLRVRISADGTVIKAEIVDPIHPSYDMRLVRAASSWTYHPATRGGTAVESERLVNVHLKDQ